LKKLASARWYCYLLVSAVVLLVLSGCGDVSDLSLPAKGNLSGRVVTDKGVALEGATVTDGSLSTTTDKDGRYHFWGVTPGDQTVSASLAGYADDGRGTRSVYVMDYRVTDVTHVDDLILVPNSGASALHP
jgi:hypothetical protein